MNINEHFKKNGLKELTIEFELKTSSIWGYFQWRYFVGMYLLKLSARVLRVGFKNIEVKNEN